MKTKLLLSLLTAIAIVFAPLSYSYDKALADSYASLFQPASGAKAGKALHMIPPDKFVEKLNKGEKFLAIDVRTEKESGLFTMSLPGSVAIPINELFQDANLKLIPADVPVIVVCKSGSRATAAGTALRHIGFSNVYILKGGLKALTMYVGPGEVYAPVMQKTTAMK